MAQLIMKRTQWTNSSAWLSAINETTTALKRKGFMSRADGGSEAYIWRVPSDVVSIAPALTFIERIHDVIMLLDDDK